jgi:hypothetical protein
MLQAGSEREISARIMARIGETFIVFSLVDCLLGHELDHLTWIKEGTTFSYIFSSAGKPPHKRATSHINVVTGRRTGNTIGFIGRLLPMTRQLANRNRRLIYHENYNTI